MFDEAGSDWSESDTEFNSEQMKSILTRMTFNSTEDFWKISEKVVLISKSLFSAY